MAVSCHLFYTLISISIFNWTRSSKIYKFWLINFKVRLSYSTFSFIFTSSIKDFKSIFFSLLANQHQNDTIDKNIKINLFLLLLTIIHSCRTSWGAEYCQTFSSKCRPHWLPLQLPRTSRKTPYYDLLSPILHLFSVQLEARNSGRFHAGGQMWHSPASSWAWWIRARLVFAWFFRRIRNPSHWLVWVEWLHDKCFPFWW